MSDQLTEQEESQVELVLKYGVVSPGLKEDKLKKILNKAAHIKFGEFLELFEAMPEKIVSQLAKHYGGILNEISRDLGNKP